MSVVFPLDCFFAKYLKLSKSKMYEMVQRGKIPYIKIGKNMRIKETALKSWLVKQEG